MSWWNAPLTLPKTPPWRLLEALRTCRVTKPVVHGPVVVATNPFVRSQSSSRGETVFVKVQRSFFKSPWKAVQSPFSPRKPHREGLVIRPFSLRKQIPIDMITFAIVIVYDSQNRLKCNLLRSTSTCQNYLRLDNGMNMEIPSPAPTSYHRSPYLTLDSAGLFAFPPIRKFQLFFCN